MTKKTLWLAFTSFDKDLAKKLKNKEYRELFVIMQNLLFGNPTKQIIAVGRAKRMNHPALTNALIYLLEHTTNEDFQRHIIDVLGESYDSRAIPSLLKFLKNENLRENAEKAFYKLSSPRTKKPKKLAGKVKISRIRGSLPKLKIS